MRVKEYMVDFIVKYAADNKHGYTNKYPNNQWWQDVDNNDCGSLMSYVLHMGLLQIGIDTGKDYFEPTGNKTPWNEKFLLKYCNKFDYSAIRNEPADILTSNGHTEMVTAVNPDYLGGARNDYDGKSGDSSGLEVAVSKFFNASGGWNYIYRLKDEYNKEISAPVKDETCKVEIRVLREGMQGDDVKLLQTSLNLWLSKDEPLLVDGKFGKLTGDRLEKYQTIQGLVADRVCGKQTWTDILSC